MTAPLVHLEQGDEHLFAAQDPEREALVDGVMATIQEHGWPERTTLQSFDWAALDQVREIAETKMPDLNANDIDAAMKIIAGTARQMGIDTEL